MTSPIGMDRFADLMHSEKISVNPFALAVPPATMKSTGFSDLIDYLN
jgi:hypothetical protein